MPATGRSTSCFFNLLPDLARLSEARHFIGGAAREAGFSEEKVFDIMVASSEALANAVEHATGRQTISVETRLFPDRFEVSVQGTGRFEMPDRSSKCEHRGLGLPLMAKLSDHLALYSAPQGGTLVTLAFFRDGHEEVALKSPLPPALLELLESSDRLEALLDAVPGAFGIIDAESRWRYLNQTALLEDGRPLADLIGRPVWEGRPDLVEARFPDLVARTKRLGRPIREELFNPVRQHWSEITAFPFGDGVAYFRLEITERKSAEARLRQDRALLRGVADILEEALSQRSEEELGEICLEVAQEITESSIGFLGEVGEDGLVHDVAMSNTGWDACNALDRHGQRRLPGSFKLHGIYGWVLSEAESVLTNHPASHVASIGVPPGHPPLLNFLGVPLTRKSKVAGMIAVANRAGGYGPEQQEMLEALAPVVIEAIDRKRGEKALQEGNEATSRGLPDLG